VAAEFLDGLPTWGDAEWQRSITWPM